MDWTSPYIRTDEDRLWFDEGLRFGYRLRKPAAPFWRLPVIRHLRAFWQMLRVEQWNASYEAIGIKPPGYEAWITYAIWRGWC